MPHHWIGFFVLVFILLVVDLVLLQRPGRPVSVRLAWIWTVILAAVAGCFAVYIGHLGGKERAVEFIAGYLIEGSLSVDNLFIFLILFRALHLGMEQQKRILLWGILGAIVLRALLVIAGTTLLTRFAWVQYAFGAFLAVAAVRLLLEKPESGKVSGPVSWVQKCCLRYVSDTHLAFGSLLLVIGAIELTDLIFALDSIPAVLAVTRDPYVAFTSNIFAVLGLRSLYFAIASLLERFRLLHYGLACILGFVAFKMLAAHWIEIPSLWSLVIILAILGAFAVLSKLLDPPAEA